MHLIMFIYQVSCFVALLMFLMYYSFQYELYNDRYNFVECLEPFNYYDFKSLRSMIQTKNCYLVKFVKFFAYL